MKRVLFAALSAGLVASQGMAAQSTRSSIQGVWRVVEATTTGAGARTIPFGDRPTLTIFTAKHYSRVEVQADGPRPILADVAKASADELRAVWGPFVSEAGTYEATPDGVITINSRKSFGYGPVDECDQVQGQNRTGHTTPIT